MHNYFVRYQMHVKNQGYILKLSVRLPTVYSASSTTVARQPLQFVGHKSGYLLV